jgi:hypothetical protein
MKPLIEIDFQGGTHGNFLKYILNDCLLSEKIHHPFTDIGTSHLYIKDEISGNDDTLVHAQHYKEYNVSFKSSNIIVIEVDKNTNLLNLQSSSFYRAGDYRIIEAELSNNTFNKLTAFKNQYAYMIESLRDNYGIELSKINPDCPRYILREFFKFQFRDPDISGFVGPYKEWIKTLKNTDKKVYVFPVSSFYDYEKFDSEISKIEEFFSLNFVKRQYQHAYEKFIQGLDYFLNLNVLPDKIISAVQEKTELEFGNLTILQESYINGNLERIYGKEMPFMQEQYFTNTKEIIEYLQL